MCQTDLSKVFFLKSNGPFMYLKSAEKESISHFIPT